MLKSKKFQVRLIVGVPLIFFGITILTANLTNYLTMLYVRNSIPLNSRFLLDSISFSHLKLWVLVLASFSFLCGFGLIYAIIHPMKKLIDRAENINYYLNSSDLSNEGEIEYFYSMFDEVLSLLKSNLILGNSMIQTIILDIEGTITTSGGSPGKFTNFLQNKLFYLLNDSVG